MSGDQARVPAPARSRPPGGGPGYGKKLWATGLAGALVLVAAPLAANTWISLPTGPRPRETMAVLVAAAGPAMFFALTAPMSATPTGAQTALAVLSKFTATLILDAGLCFLAVAGLLGLAVAVPALVVAMIVALGTLTLTKDRLLGVLPLLLTLLLACLLCFSKRFADPADTSALRAAGVLAAALVCAVLLLTSAVLQRRVQARQSNRSAG